MRSRQAEDLLCQHRDGWPVQFLVDLRRLYFQSDDSVYFPTVEMIQQTGELLQVFHDHEYESAYLFGDGSAKKVSISTEGRHWSVDESDEENSDNTDVIQIGSGMGHVSLLVGVRRDGDVRFALTGKKASCVSITLSSLDDAKFLLEQILSQGIVEWFTHRTALRFEAVRKEET